MYVFVVMRRWLGNTFENETHRIKFKIEFKNCVNYVL